jgi:hypothetical protein
MQDKKMPNQHLNSCRFWSDTNQPIRLRLSAKSVSQPTVFFSKKKPANNTFSQPDQPKRIGRFEHRRTEKSAKSKTEPCNKELNYFPLIYIANEGVSLFGVL